MSDKSFGQFGGKVKGGIAVTVITATRPRYLSKRFALVDGQLEKTPGGQLADGIAETKRFPDFQAFVAAVADLTPANAMTFGVTSHDQARIVGQDAVARTTDPKLPIVARIRENFAYPAGPAILMIDYDPPKNAETVYSNEDLLALLYGIWPALKHAPHVLTATASSYIYNGNEQLIGQKGRRLYILISDGRDIPRAGKNLFHRLQLAGLGHIEISKSGRMLERGIIDACVYQPERLDFAGGAECVAPLVQRRPAPIIFNADAAPLDTRTLPSLTPTEEVKRLGIVDNLKAPLTAEAEATRKVWIEARVAETLKKKPTAKPEKLREVYRAASEHCDLYGDFELAMADGKTLTVAEILAEPDRYHGKRCADPLEPTYGNDSRIAYINLRAGVPYILSHAHHGVRYTLRRERMAHVLQAGERGNAVDTALAALRATGEYFERNEEIVKVTADGTITPLNLHRIQLALDRIIHWQRYSKKGQLVPCDCPKNIAEGVLAMKGAWNLPVLAAVATAPLFHPKAGRIIENDGFDADGHPIGHARWKMARSS